MSSEFVEYHPRGIKTCEKVHQSTGIYSTKLYNLPLQKSQIHNKPWQNVMPYEFF